ncbi:methionyl-tRNA formyltransferase-like protein [Bradyrhizobium stylosanthis]|uniref:Methionyl-tRNA formyltransferase-like protein n=1 Tax=Bradyrhizobium stylosanthis TaxID=1803665 RepID=A0A560CVX2_9BRAD|nr:methionyl-tRNA formyltransferase-like protein [Bradyrhizobium stylosanthis]TWA89000.1 hypothetical protein FBZ96_12216 [Bradyrhizobium stylosanthis]
MEELSELLAIATAGIEPGFFRLTIHGGAAVYRERVYCYELYHQMRRRWPEECAFTLNGEVDKIAHPTLSQLGAAGYKPDLLVHQPGHMGHANHAVIEVKSVLGAYRGVKKDLTTLALFRRNVGYARAIYLIYGEEADDELAERVAIGVTKYAPDVPIELWFHTAALEPARHVRTLHPTVADERSARMIGRRRR